MKATDIVVTRMGARFMGRAFPCSIGRGGIVPARAKREGDGFSPFVMESYGGFGERALALLQRIEDEGACIDASPHRLSKRHFMAWAAVEWQRHNFRIFAEWRRLLQEL